MFSAAVAAAAGARTAAAATGGNGSCGAKEAVDLEAVAGDAEGRDAKQKTYPCPECGKIFNAHYNLTRHMPVHTGQ